MTTIPATSNSGNSRPGIEPPSLEVQRWVRFSHSGSIRFGQLEGDEIRVFQGDMYSEARPTEVMLRLSDVAMLCPTVPGKVIVMYNNFGALLEKLKVGTPTEPLYFTKTPNTYLGPDAVIGKPSCDSRIVFEGEMAIVIGTTCKNVSEAQALSCVFGYSCANDVTAVDILTRHADFAHWARAKNFDGFCPFGPVIARGLDPEALVVRTVLNGIVRQEFPISDMLFSVPRLVSTISRDMTLNPGDLILCGTSLGVGVMKSGSTVEVEIAGIGKLRNRFE